MSTPYLSDKVKALLNTAVWYVRLKKVPQAQRVFNQAVTLVENEGGLREPDLRSVLEQYASSFRRLSRMSEAEKLSAIAQRIRAAFPGLFNPDGSEIPWWRRPEFLRSLPALPVEFKASRAEYSSVKPFSLGCLGTLFVGGLLIGTVLRPVVDWLGGAAFLIFLFVIPLSGVLADWWQGRFIERKGKESWCKLTAEGIEYHEPNKSCLDNRTKMSAIVSRDGE